MNGIKFLSYLLFLYVLTACSSSNNNSQGEKFGGVIPQSAENNNSQGEKFGGVIPQSADEHFLYLNQQIIIDHGGDWYAIFQNWVSPRLDSFHSHLVKFPEGEESAYHGRNALNDGFDRVCTYHGGTVILSDVYYDSTRRDCIVGVDTNVGYLTVRNSPMPPTDAKGYEREHWAINVAYGSEYHLNKMQEFENTFEDRRSEQVGGVIELSDGEMIHFRNFGFKQRNHAYEVRYEGSLNDFFIPIQEVAYIDYYPESGASVMGVLLNDGQFRLNQGQYYIEPRLSQEQEMVYTGLQRNSIRIVELKRGQAQNREILLQYVRRIYIGSQDVQETEAARKMQIAHLSILEPLIAKESKLEAERQLARERGERERLARIARQEERERFLQTQLRQIELRREAAADRYGQGVQVCKKGKVTFRGCANRYNAMTCQEHETEGAIYGYVINRFPNNFLEVRLNGVSNVPNGEMSLYRNFGVGPLMLDNMPTSPGTVVRLDPLEVYACNVY